jgi:hypothetical protein
MSMYRPGVVWKAPVWQCLTLHVCPLPELTCQDGNRTVGRVTAAAEILRRARLRKRASGGLTVSVPLFSFSIGIEGHPGRGCLLA